MNNKKMTLHDIIVSTPYEQGMTTFPTGSYRQYTIQSELAIIASYFNRGWKRTKYNTGYFIAYKRKNRFWGNKWELAVIKHRSEFYPGVVYFKNKKDAEFVIKLANLKEKYKSLGF